MKYSKMVENIFPRLYDIAILLFHPCKTVNQ